jgi:hypothetical protein
LTNDDVIIVQFTPNMASSQEDQLESGDENREKELYIRLSTLVVSARSGL